MSKQLDVVKNLIKNNVAEDASLNRYLLSRGINPKYVSKDQKVAHSKMGQFKKWKRDHENMDMVEQTTEPSPSIARLKELNKSKKHQTPIVKGVAEAVDKKDTITFDIPLLIRVLELAREDIKSDMDLHRVVERLINMRDKGMLTMDDYDEIAAIKEEVFGSTPLEYIKQALSDLKENHIAIAMGKMLDDEGSMVLNQMDDIDRCSQMVRDYIGKDYEKQLPAWVQAKITLASDYINTVGTYLASKNENVKEEVEMKEEFKKGDRVKHKDGTLGTVTREPDELGIVSWKHAGNKHRVSHKSALKSAAGEKFRWRKYDEEVEQVDEVRRGGFTAGWRDEKYFGKGVPTNRPMTDKEKAESEKTKDIQNYLNNLSKNRLKKEDVELDEASDTAVINKQGKVVSWSHEGDWKKTNKKKNPEGKIHNITGQALQKTKKLSKEDIELDEARYGGRFRFGGDAFQKDSASSVSGFGKSSREDDEYHTPSKHHVRVQVSKGDGPKTHFKATVRAKEPQHAVSAAIAHYKKQGYTVHNHEYLGEQVEQIAEISDTTLSSYKEKAKKSADELHSKGEYKKSANRWMNVMKATGKQMSKMKFENTLDPKAATEAPCDCANNPDDVAPQDKNKKLIQMSKSARIIKSIYNKKNMKEEIYDHEKEGKSVATYGKKPKLSDSEKKIEAVGGQPKAAAIMTGGTTLTGTPRDTVEIDPMMKPPKPGSLGQLDNLNQKTNK